MGRMILMGEIIQLFGTDRERGRGPDLTPVVIARYSFDIALREDGYYEYHAKDHMAVPAIDPIAMRAFLAQFDYYLQCAPKERSLARIQFFTSSDTSRCHLLFDGGHFKTWKQKWYLFKRLWHSFFVLCGWRDNG